MSVVFVTELSIKAQNGTPTCVAPIMCRLYFSEKKYLKFLKTTFILFERGRGGEGERETKSRGLPSISSLFKCLHK